MYRLGLVTALAFGVASLHAADAKPVTDAQYEPTVKMTISNVKEHYNLSSEKGLNRLYSRVESDARRVCDAGWPDVDEYWRVHSYGQCVAKTVDSAIEASNIAPLKHYYASQPSYRLAHDSGKASASRRS